MVSLQHDLIWVKLLLPGSKQSNPWVSLFEAKLNFGFEYQIAGHNIFIVNRAQGASMGGAEVALEILANPALWSAALPPKDGPATYLISRRSSAPEH